MTRLVISIGTLLALMTIASAAKAESYAFTIGGHRFHVEAPRNCRSMSCVAVSSRNLRPAEDVVTTPAPPPAPVAHTPQPVPPAAPVRPPQATVIAPPPAPTAPVIAATSSQPVVLPPMPQRETPRFEALSANPPADKRARLNTNLAYRSSAYGTLDASAYSRIPAHTVTNLSAGARSQGERSWDISLWARNVFDRQYYTSMWNGGFGSYNAVIGTPRTLGTSARLDF